MHDQQDGPKVGALSERFSLDGLIMGIINDLDDLRNGKISVKDAQARAELAKQAMNGVRLVINAQKFIENQAIPVGNSSAP
jgi:type III secretory pathway component EscV